MVVVVVVVAVSRSESTMMAIVDMSFYNHCSGVLAPIDLVARAPMVRGKAAHIRVSDQQSLLL